LVVVLFAFCVVAFLVYRSFSRTSQRLAVNDASKNLLEPLFNNKFDDFFLSLNVPLKHGVAISNEDAYTCGRLVMVYLSHNPEDAKAFVESLDGNSPEEALSYELMLEHDQSIRTIGFRAISTITSRYSHRCFSGIDVDRVNNKLFELERHPHAFHLDDGLNSTLRQGVIPEAYDTLEEARAASLSPVRQ
jgi:hypothetical protein